MLSVRAPFPQILGTVLHFWCSGDTTELVFFRSWNSAMAHLKLSLGITVV